MDLQTKRAYIGIRVAKSLEDMATAQEMLVEAMDNNVKADLTGSSTQ